MIDSLIFVQTFV